MQLNEITKNNIIKIIKYKNMSVRSLGKKAPFSTNHIYKYLNGSRKISLETLDVFSKLLDVKSTSLIDKNFIIK